MCLTKMMYLSICPTYPFVLLCIVKMCFLTDAKIQKRLPFIPHSVSLGLDTQIAHQSSALIMLMLWHTECNIYLLNTSFN